MSNSSGTRRYIFIGFMVVVMLLGVYACRKAGTWLVKHDPPLHADAMVMLMGGIAPDRILESADHYKSGLAGRLIIVQENMGAYRELEKRGAHIISSTEQSKEATVALGIPADSITILPGDARSTQTEAVIVRNYLAKTPGIDTLTLITSTDHSRRAFLIFNEAFHKAGLKVTLLSNPSRYSGFKPDGWWKRKEDTQAVVMEWVKMLNFYIVDQRKL